MITLYGRGYSKEDLESYRTVVYNNTLSSMKTLLEANTDLSEDWLDTNPNAPEEEDPFWCECDERFIEIVEDAPIDSGIDQELGEAIKVLWNDKALQNTWDERSRFQIMDSAAYFFGRINEIMAAGYCPDEQDVLRSRVRTTGIVETTFEIEGNVFKMFDVGGQRSERKNGFTVLRM
eukprot:GABV01000349.1.p1 GENE.GABV01000349.1~~GABV01000349.1.p1  ORF type:complete len:177 (+),score=72.35 GABV01000349.1:304-834(+)